MVRHIYRRNIKLCVYQQLLHRNSSVARTAHLFCEYEHFSVREDLNLLITNNLSCQVILVKI